MALAELIAQASLLTIGVFLIAAAISTAKEKWLPPCKEKKPRNRKENQSMTNNTKGCGHTPLQHVTIRIQGMAAQAKKDSADPTFTDTSPETAALVHKIVRNIVDKILIPALQEEQIREEVASGVDEMLAFLKSEAH